MNFEIVIIIEHKLTILYDEVHLLITLYANLCVSYIYDDLSRSNIISPFVSLLNSILPTLFFFFFLVVANII